jgi:hypothetical protein
MRSTIGSHVLFPFLSSARSHRYQPFSRLAKNPLNARCVRNSHANLMRRLCYASDAQPEVPSSLNAQSRCSAIGSQRFLYASLRWTLPAQISRRAATVAKAGVLFVSLSVEARGPSRRINCPLRRGRVKCLRSFHRAFEVNSHTNRHKHKSKRKSYQCSSKKIANHFTLHSVS